MAIAKRRVFKNKKALSGVKTEYRAWKEWDEGDVVVCKLIGTSPNRKNKNKKDWIVEVEEIFLADKKEEKRLKGKKVTLNSAGQLDKGMVQVANGQVVEITYNGQVEMEGGDYAGEMAHQHEVNLISDDEDSSDDIDAEDDDVGTDEEDEDEDDL